MGSEEERGSGGDGLPAPITPGRKRVLLAQPHLDSSWQLQGGGGAEATGTCRQSEEGPGGEETKARAACKPRRQPGHGECGTVHETHPILSRAAGPGVAEASAGSPFTARVSSGAQRGGWLPRGRREWQSHAWDLAVWPQPCAQPWGREFLLPSPGTPVLPSRSHHHWAPRAWPMCLPQEVVPTP